MIRILSTRPLVAACALSLVAACGGRAAAPIEVRQRFEVKTLPAVDVRLLLQPEHQRDRDRYLRAAMTTLQICGAWLGPFAGRSVTFVDPSWRAPAPGVDEAIVLERTPWWGVTTSMAPEFAIARPLSHRFISDAIDTRRLPPWFVDGLAEYATRRGVMPIFAPDSLLPDHAFLEERPFHGFVPAFIRSRLFAQTNGNPVSAYRAHAAVGSRSNTGSVDEVQRRAGRTVLALGTLERWLGRPVFDAVVAEFVAASRGTQPTLDDFERAASRLSGQDLSWFFDAAFGASDEYDYGIDGLTSPRSRDGSFETTVVVRRYGEARFTGSSAPPIGDYESGRGMVLLVTFADGRRQTDYWDGRSRQKTFRYRSAARAVSAVVDPDRRLLLDLRQTNNSMTLTPLAGTAANRWARRYMVWLEDLLLSYASLV